ncbi:radical SAM protein [Photobacterium swingsii]|uniref:S-adenosylmethionine-dependent nucleotide dehydratase n=1 Tax=Photobacterium swingsii TaxID=680026 RepID=A0A2T3NRM3_9GAMM|nr:viperin family antiviral radical SAM protein [Photobacterium swingsii]PSW18885.1 radical SAM protein [Photobacterium swingsii]
MSTKQLVINFHMTERCNYNCHYCYAKWEKPNEIHKQEGTVNQLLTNLSNYFLNPNPVQSELGYDSVRLNFAGGEPLLLKNKFIDAIDCAISLGFDISIITNGHLLTESFIKEQAHRMSMIGISYDSANQACQQQIGRNTRSGSVITPRQLSNISHLIRKHAPKTELKINTVVNQFNINEDLSSLISEVKPDKWKLLQVLGIYDEIPEISDSDFTNFVTRHQSLNSVMSIEDNASMRGSYLMIDPSGCFFQNENTHSGYLKSRSLLTTPVGIALKESGFNPKKFSARYK